MRAAPIVSLAAIYAVLMIPLACIPCRGGELARVAPSGGEVVVERDEDGTVRVIVPTAHGRVVIEVVPTAKPPLPTPQDPGEGAEAVEILSKIPGLARVDVAGNMAVKARDAAMLLRQGRLLPHEAAFYWQSETEAALGPRYKEYLQQIRAVVALIPPELGDAEKVAVLLGRISLALDGVTP